MICDDSYKNIYPFSLLAALQAVEQSVQHHPEGNVWNHTLLVVDCAATLRNLSNNARIFMWAALLHDLGKIPATRVRKGRVTAYDHDKLGAGLVMDFLGEFTSDKDFIQQVANLVRWHMQALFVSKQLPFTDLETMIKEVTVEEIALLSLCDRLGRGKMSEPDIAQECKHIEYFIKQCQQVLDKELPNRK